VPTQKKPAPNQEALYDKLIATIPEIERKGDANPYTSLNGNMFTLLHQSRLAIRLPEAEREAFLKRYKTTLFEAYGTVMKEYVAVPDDLLGKTKETDEISRDKLRIRQDAKAEAHKKEQVRGCPTSGRFGQKREL
jgi:TfoX/Sxy family transcriptional regulator of competence genes